ncbi:MAG: hypothetical protein AAF357_05095 [Verrucomicrobiota bacterium]
MVQAPTLFMLIFVGLGCPISWAEGFSEGFRPSAAGSFSPELVTPEDIRSLMESSPFSRSLKLVDTLVLTGLVQIGEEQMATVLDTEDGRSISLSESPNERGWRLVEVRAAEDLEMAVVSLAFERGEVVRIRHDKERIKSTNQRLGFQRKANAQRLAAQKRMQDQGGSGGGHGVPRGQVVVLQRIARNNLPDGYQPGAGNNREESHRLHQSYVDRRMAGMSDRQRGRVGQLWKQKQAVEPMMPNRGASFVKIMEHVAENEPR